MKEEKLRNFSHIAKLIRTKRLSHPKRYSQSELSKLLGYKNGQFISNVERSLCSVPLKMLSKVSKILSIDEADIKEALLEDHRSTISNYLSCNDEIEDAKDPLDKKASTAARENYSRPQLGK